MAVYTSSRHGQAVHVLVFFRCCPKQCQALFILFKEQHKAPTCNELLLSIKVLFIVMQNETNKYVTIGIS